MEKATQNSKTILKNIKKKYNKTRQSHITYELIEIISGTESIKKYFEGFQEDLLHEDFCGVRARLGSSHNEADFSILFEENHGIHGLINLSGIESPGLTSALSIAKYVCKKI